MRRRMRRTKLAVVTMIILPSEGNEEDDAISTTGEDC
jgi:hypothetical protein